MKKIFTFLLAVSFSYSLSAQINKVYNNSDFLLSQGFGEVPQGVDYKAGHIVLNSFPSAGTSFGWRIKNDGRYSPNAWASGVTYTPYNTVTNAGKVYLNQGSVAGTSVIPPTHTSGDVADGNLLWTYMAPYSVIEPILSYEIPKAIEDGNASLNLNLETRPYLTQYNSPTNWVNKPANGYYTINTIRNATSPTAQGYQTAAGISPYNGFYYRNLSVGGWSNWFRFVTDRDTADNSASMATIGQLQHRIDSLSATLNIQALNGSATLDFPSTTAGAVADLTVTVSGAVDGDVVSIGVPQVSITATGQFTAWVSAANTVTIRFTPTAVEDPASGTFKVKVLK